MVDVFLRVQVIPSYFICPQCGYVMQCKDLKRHDKTFNMFCTNRKCGIHNQIYEYKIPTVDAKLIGTVED